MDEMDKENCWATTAGRGLYENWAKPNIDTTIVNPINNYFYNSQPNK